MKVTLSKKKMEFDILPRVMKKASQAYGNYFVGAIAFSRKGNVLGTAHNIHNSYFSERRGSNRHAEQRLIEKFGRAISVIYIVRVGKDLSRLPIHPCEKCLKKAEKFGIKIIPLHMEFGYKPTEHYM